VSATAEAVICVEQPDGCVFCAGKDEPAPFLEPDQSRPLLCDPKDEDDCVEFCSVATPACALPWSKQPSCVVESEIEFRRGLFNRLAADRPEVALAGRVVDENGKRIEGARVRLWLARGPWPGLVPLIDEVSGKDGTFQAPLRSGPWAYALRISQPGRATTIVDRVPSDRLERPPGGAPRIFRLGPEEVIRGRVVDGDTGDPVAGAAVEAVRAPEDAIEVGETVTGEDGAFGLGGLERGRYFLRVSKFGWRPSVGRAPVAAPAQKVTLKLASANVIRGVAVDADGEPEPNATVVAVLSSAPGVASPPIFWTTDGEGRFAQDHFVPGTYYLWARHGDMLAYPPSRIELTEKQDAAVRIALSHKGARVVGQALPQAGGVWNSEVSAVLVSLSPLAFPRNAVAKVDRDGHFAMTGVLPGRYRLALRAGLRSMTITKGPREVEVPIEPGGAVALREPVIARPQTDE
jgi:protocatechuate 3,4-dioxygenase beta subunit